jgi:hypothetical protein
MKNKFFVFGMLALVFGFVFIGCDTGNGNNDPTPPTATYLNEKSWVCTSGYMGDGITSQTFVFSETNQWTNTMGGGSHDGQTVTGTYTVSGLTMALTVTGGTLTGGSLPSVGTQFFATFDATQAIKFIIASQSLTFNRQP